MSNLKKALGRLNSDVPMRDSTLITALATALENEGFGRLASRIAAMNEDRMSTNRALVGLGNLIAKARGGANGI